MFPILKKISRIFKLIILQRISSSYNFRTLNIFSRKQRKQQWFVWCQIWSRPKPDESKTVFVTGHRPFSNLTISICPVRLVSSGLTFSVYYQNDKPFTFNSLCVFFSHSRHIYYFCLCFLTYNNPLTISTIPHTPFIS